MSRDEEIRTQVERILSAPEFSSSYRLSRLLQYLVDQHLANPQKSVSEYHLGFEVFERPSDFDPQTDSVVRVQTARLRQKLVAYYVDTGRNDEILIVIPRGRYAVNVSFREIQKPDGVSIASTTTTVTPQEKNTITSRFRLLFFRTAWLVGGSFLLIVAAAAIYARTFWWNKRPLEPTAIHFTYYPGLEDNASFSPDGTSVAFSGSSENGREIFIKEIANGKLRQVTHDKSVDIHPAWSPDGSSIAFYRAEENGGEFVIVSLNGVEHVVEQSRSARIGAPSTSSRMPDVGPEWSGNNNLIVADKDGEGGNESLFFINLKDGSRTQLTFPVAAASIGDLAPAVSPDGKSIAFVRVSSIGASDIFIVPLHGGSPRRITSDNVDINGVAWDASGRQLIFSSKRDGSYRLWRINLDSGQMGLFPASGLNALHPAVDPTQNRLIYTEWNINSNIWRVDLRVPFEKRKPVAWITSTVHQDSPQYSPDGKSIVFFSDRTGYWELWLANSEGGDLHQITHFEGATAGSPQWSPNGQEIAFDLRAKGVSNVFTFNVKTEAIRQITQENSDTMEPRWSGDGGVLYVVSKKTGLPQIWKVPLDGNPWIQLTHKGGFDGTERLGFSQLIFTRPSTGFSTLDLRTGQESEILELASVKSYRYWAMSPDGIYYFSAADTHRFINFYDFKTHRISRVFEMSGAIYGGTPSLTVSPDGHYLAYAQVDSFNADLVLVRNW